MLRNKSPDSSLPTGSTAASITSEYDSVGYVTLLIVRKLLIFFFYNFQEGVLIFAIQHFITLIRKSYFAE